MAAVDSDYTQTLRIRTPYHRALRILAAKLGKKHRALIEGAIVSLLKEHNEPIPADVREMEKARAKGEK